MKKRLVITLVLVGLLAFGAGIGTFAWFSQTLVSNSNVIKAANFSVSSDGLDENVEFEIPRLAPGEWGIYDFTVDKSNTDVPIKYNFKVTSNGFLFNENSPIKLYLLDYNGENYEIIANGYREISGTVIPVDNVEGYALMWKWVPSDNDNSYIGKSGKVNIQLTATQTGPSNVIYTSIWGKEKLSNGNKESFHETGVRVEYNATNNYVKVHSERKTYEGTAHVYPGANGAIQLKDDAKGLEYLNIKVPQEIVNQFAD
jgi:predicted ribosomally synthesized peptide with SipW-like signal peptide